MKLPTISRLTIVSVALTLMGALIPVQMVRIQTNIDARKNTQEYEDTYSYEERVLMPERGNIYDRWGNLVFKSSVIPFVWNGKFVDEDVMPGVYVYLVKVTYTVDSKEHERVFTGDVTVLR